MGKLLSILIHRARALLKHHVSNQTPITKQQPNWPLKLTRYRHAVLDLLTIAVKPVKSVVVPFSVPSKRSNDFELCSCSLLSGCFRHVHHSLQGSPLPCGKVLIKTQLEWFKFSWLHRQDQRESRGTTKTNTWRNMTKLTIWFASKYIAVSRPVHSSISKVNKLQLTIQPSRS